jgi:hypothetical protein
MNLLTLYPQQQTNHTPCSCQSFNNIEGSRCIVSLQKLLQYTKATLQYTLCSLLHK